VAIASVPDPQVAYEHVRPRNSHIAGLRLSAVDMRLDRSPRQRSGPFGSIVPFALAAFPLDRCVPPQRRRTCQQDAD